MSPGSRREVLPPTVPTQPPPPPQPASPRRPGPAIVGNLEDTEPLPAEKRLRWAPGRPSRQLGGRSPYVLHAAYDDLDPEAAARGGPPSLSAPATIISVGEASGSSRAQMP
jgi:hypothetical protein